MAALCFSAKAQFPYFQQDHTSATTGINYANPVDIQYDGASIVYSYHSTATGTVVAKYDVTTGSLINVVYVVRGSLVATPVRVRTQGANYYALFNITTAGVPQFYLASINATTDVLNWGFAFNPPASALSRTGVDFMLDGGSYAYILSNAYDPAAGQYDLAVTKLDISTLTPGIVWDNVYQNLSRSEVAWNIDYRSEDQIVISAISLDLVNPLSDRGPMLMKIDAMGTYIVSMLYKYSSGCTSVRPTGAWVVIGTNNDFLSCTSLAGADGNGPIWLAKINAATLAINAQTTHSSGAAYMSPEIQPVTTTASGSFVLMSGAAPSVNTNAPGYVHLFFNSALTFVQGTLYPTTFPYNFGGSIFDAYISSGPDKNIFTVAANASAAGRYHLLKTSTLGDNGCDTPFTVSPITCTMSAYAMPITQVPVAMSGTVVKVSVTQMSNNFVQSCTVQQ